MRAASERRDSATQALWRAAKGEAVDTGLELAERADRSRLTGMLFARFRGLAVFLVVCLLHMNEQMRGNPRTMTHPQMSFQVGAHGESPAAVLARTLVGWDRGQLLPAFTLRAAHACDLCEPTCESGATTAD